MSNLKTNLMSNLKADLCSEIEALRAKIAAQAGELEALRTKCSEQHTMVEALRAKTNVVVEQCAQIAAPSPMSEVRLVATKFGRMARRNPDNPAEIQVYGQSGWESISH